MYPLFVFSYHLEVVLVLAYNALIFHINNGNAACSVDAEAFHQLAHTMVCLAVHYFICQPEKKDGNVNDKERKDTLKQILLTCFPQTKMTHLCISTKPCSCSRPWSCTETAIIVYLRNTAKVRILILKLLGIAHSPKACRTTAS